MEVTVIERNSIRPFRNSERPRKEKQYADPFDDPGLRWGILHPSLCNGSGDQSAAKDPADVAVAGSITVPAGSSLKSSRRARVPRSS